MNASTAFAQSFQKYLLQIYSSTSLVIQMTGLNSHIVIFADTQHKETNDSNK